jgi:hypothetical protein
MRRIGFRHQQPREKYGCQRYSCDAQKFRYAPATSASTAVMTIAFDSAYCSEGSRLLGDRAFKNLLGEPLAD